MSAKSYKPILSGRLCFSKACHSSSARPQDPIQLLKHSADAKNFKHGKMIHAHLIITNNVTEYSIVPVNSLVHFNARCDRIQVAHKLFDKMSDRNVVSWSALMAGYLHNGFSLQVIKLFKDMIFVNNVSPNEYILVTVFASCSDGGRVLEGFQCHGFALKFGSVNHQYVRNALIHMYSKCYRVQEALWIFDSVPGNDIFACNSILVGLTEIGCLMESVNVMKKMVIENVTWDSVTYVSVLGLCGSLKDLRFGSQVHGKMLIFNAKCDAYENSAVINMYGRCGDPSKAERVFDRLKNPNVVLWTAIITAYFQNGCFEKALNMFAKMKQKGVRPNDITFAVLLKASSGLSSLRHGNLLHACVEKSGFKDHIIVGNGLIYVYVKGGIIESAYKVFSNMLRRDTVTWNAVICGYSHHGLGKEALQVFQGMLDAGEHPNYVTFVGVLSACSHLGLKQEGMYYLNSLMKQLGVEPGLEHYTCIVGLLSKAGQLNEALNFMKSMPVEWDIIAWRTILNACHVRQNHDLAKQIAKMVLIKDPNDVGTYTLLSNIYAKQKRWDGVVKMRKLMRDKNIKKEPGVSWIEIGNATHVFLSEDGKHPEYNQIYAKVKELLTMIVRLGYTPNIGSVLHDVKDEQKGDYLSYHSEKLAIAYGLMKLPSGSPIVVIKNLRVCEDCHTSIKLISEVTNRQIIVRDANRFHHFENGSCSCSDYW